MLHQYRTSGVTHSSHSQHNTPRILLVISFNSIRRRPKPWYEKCHATCQSMRGITRQPSLWRSPSRLGCQPPEEVMHVPAQCTRELLAISTRVYQRLDSSEHKYYVLPLDEGTIFNHHSSCVQLQMKPHVHISQVIDLLGRQLSKIWR
jgi:hypothetical protein